MLQGGVRRGGEKKENREAIHSLSEERPGSWNHSLVSNPLQMVFETGPFLGAGYLIFFLPAAQFFIFPPPHRHLVHYIITALSILLRFTINPREQQASQSSRTSGCQSFCIEGRGSQPFGYGDPQAQIYSQGWHTVFCWWRQTMNLVPIYSSIPFARVANRMF